VKRQLRPSIEALKLRYSRDMARRKMVERRSVDRAGRSCKVCVPDNSQPRLPDLPQSLAECMWISDQIALDDERFLTVKDEKSSGKLTN
jgi:hypothetical protein